MKKLISKEDFNVRVGEFIRMQRQKKNYSTLKLQKKSGVNYTVICRLEGAIPFEEVNPKIHSLKNLLDALDKNFLDLFKYVYEKN